MEARTTIGNLDNSQWMTYAVNRTKVRLGNCFTYATARISEIVGYNQSLDGATRVDGAGQLWETHDPAFRQSSEAIPGALAIFKNGDFGHVAVVEKIEGPSIYVSQSDYGDNRDTNGNSIPDGFSYVKTSGVVGQSYVTNGSLILVGYLIHKDLNVQKKTKQTGTVTKTSKLLSKGDIVLDIASHQPADMRALCKAVGTNKTIIKVSEGTGYLNPQLKQQLDTSENVGLYHFARFGGNVSQANAEADYFIKHLPANSAGKIGMCDYENDASSNAQANTDAILAFMRKVKQAGLIPIFYTYTSYLYKADGSLNIYLDKILQEFPDCFWEAWYATMNPSDSPTWQYQPKLSGTATMWQWTSRYKGHNLDANVVLKDIGAITNTLEEALEALKEDNMNFVVRSKSGQQGYLAVVNGKRMGVGSMDTIHQFQTAGFTHLNLEDGDFNRFLSLFPTADESKTVKVDIVDEDVKALAKSLEPTK